LGSKIRWAEQTYREVHQRARYQKECHPISSRARREGPESSTALGRARRIGFEARRQCSPQHHAMSSTRWPNMMPPKPITAVTARAQIPCPLPRLNHQRPFLSHPGVRPFRLALDEPDGVAFAFSAAPSIETRYRLHSHSSPPASARWVCSGGGGSGSRQLPYE
jgi:hypothetical protein